MKDSYILIDKDKFPPCCIVCKYVDMESYWEFICRKTQKNDDVEFNGYCNDFEPRETE